MLTAGIDQAARAASPSDAVIEPAIDRTFAIVVEDDFSAAGSIAHRSAVVDGRQPMRRKLVMV